MGDPKTAPVKLIHYCNNLGKRSFGKYQTDEHWTKHLFARENSYLGLPCTCGTPEFFNLSIADGPKLASTCNHGNAFSDPNVHSFYNKIMVEEYPQNAKLNKFMQGIDAKYLGDVTSHCLAEKPYFLENFKENLKNKVQSFLKRDDVDWRRRRLIKNPTKH